MKKGFSFGNFLALQLELNDIKQQQVADVFYTDQGTICKRLRDNNFKPQEYVKLAEILGCEDIIDYAIGKQLRPFASKLLS
jgi:hypothetical protein